ncbi:MAG: PilZ domain-containing protein [Candidatus Glassbacteria bacterium]|nr:PilZ domain-containing protein [Candidatus Glassbacteria bacterium]
MNAGSDLEKRRAEREPLRAKVEFYVDADIIEAVSVDVSQAGVRFDTDKPIRIRMRMTVGDSLLEREAQLVWAERASGSDNMSYGLEYIPDCEGVI